MKKRRIVTSIVCLCMAATMLGGCSDKQEANTQTANGNAIKVFTKLKNRPDCSLVSQELSKITSEKIGTNVEFMFGYDADKITLMLASNEKMDIGFDDYNTFVDRVRQNAYVDITDMLKEETPDLYNALPEIFWEYTKVDGRNYGVPTYKEIGEQWSVLVDKKIIEEHNIDVSQIKEFKDLEVILEALSQHPDRAGYEILPDTTVHMNLVLKNKYDTVYDEFVVDRENPDKVVHFMETQEYKDYIHLMHDWYEKGYIAKDITTRTDYESYHNNGTPGIVYTQYQPDCESVFKETCNADMISIHLTPNIMSNYSMFGSMFGIYQKSENVEKSLKFLELWNTSPQVKNLIAYGIEGKHYDVVGKNKIKIKEGAYTFSTDMTLSDGEVLRAYVMNDELVPFTAPNEFDDSVKDNVTIFLAGDSTVCQYKDSQRPQAGWGEYIGEYFNENVTVVNKAVGSRSAKSFYDEGRLEQIINAGTEGDYVFVQFGHNDFEPSRSLHTEPQTTYKEYLRLYVSEIRNAAMIPVLVTPVERWGFVGDDMKSRHDGYPQAMREVAEEMNVALVDLCKLSNEFFSELGQEKASEYYMSSVSPNTDYTHMTQLGANAAAKLVADEIAKIALPIGGLFKSE